MININMNKAKEIWKNKIREDREVHFTVLDVDYLKATEAQNKTLKHYIETKKQQLRDAPEDERILNAVTPEELKVIDPITEIMTIPDLEKAKLDKYTEIDEDWKATLKEGWETPYGWSLGIDIPDVALLNGNFVLAKEAASMGIVDPVFVVDTMGQSHSFNLADLTGLMLQYGQARAVFSSQDAAKRTAIKNANTIEELNNL